jgi:hypothetical protein
MLRVALVIQVFDDCADQVLLREIMIAFAPHHAR